MSVSTIGWDHLVFQLVLRRLLIARSTSVLRIKLRPFNGYKPTSQVLVAIKARSTGSVHLLPKFTSQSQVTVFGESAGAVSIGILFLNSGFETLARAAVSYLARLSGSWLLRKHTIQILESGSADTTFTFGPLRRQGIWNDFAQSIPGCSTINSFPCIRAASSSDLQMAITLSSQKQTEQFPWVPNFDGPNGLYPDFASNLYKKGQFSRIPFIAGTNLDEGMLLIYSTVKSYMSTGTVFTPTSVSTDDTIRDWITSNFSTNAIDRALLLIAADIILDNYPNNPSLGSSFNTGNSTFGFDSQYKRLAAICKILSSCLWFYLCRSNMGSRW